MSRSSWPQDPLECWRIVASGRKRALPRGFWDGDEGLERIRVVGGYLVANGLDPLSLTDAEANALHIRGAVYRAGGLIRAD